MTRLIACSALFVVAAAALLGAASLQPETTPRSVPWAAHAASDQGQSGIQVSPAEANSDALALLEAQGRVPPRAVDGLEFPPAVHVEEPEPTSTPTPEPEEPSFWRDGVEPARVALPGTGIDAPVILGYVDEAARQMIAPDGPYDVAWYDFSALPGEGGNAVLAGHVDQANHGPAVLWDLRHVQIGDLLEVELSDGTHLQYRVESNVMHTVADGPWGELFQVDTGTDMITLYTCDGLFTNGGYESRRVVQAALIEA